MDNAEQEWPGKLKVALLSLILLTGAFYVYGQEKAAFLLNTAPVKLGAIKELVIDYRGKGPPKYYALLRLLPFANTDSLVEVKVEKLQFQQMHASDTLAVHYSLQSQKASMSPEPAPHIWYWLLGSGLLLAISLLPNHWKERLRPRPQPWLWRSAVLLLGGSMMGFTLKGCSDWTASNADMQTYIDGTHTQGRVMAASITGAPHVRVQFRPIEDLAAFAPRSYLLPLPAFHHYTFQQALALGWQPKVAIWYPAQEQERAQLLLQLQPDDISNHRRNYGFLFVLGFVLLLSQIKPLERLWKQRAYWMN
ncbi:hypothetical protein LRS06_06000 [Hymenobacter sp. J193]|uniref:hypothetical protein n=1 Tax=Hymenobacter sp. J193 TaxID=2898429 RepID=UPI00215142F6|nr:hypothetical protein [Hymenobacter sp. J193]MCR5887338.1 hypothetical protein [Hymenobacter sp. J193]